MRIEEYNIEIKFPEVKKYIYKITNTINNKSYIGQTNDIKRRICEHLEGIGSKLLLKDFVKEGIKNFTFEVLETSPKIIVDTVEDYHIEKLDTLHPRGYNLRLNRKIKPNGEHVDLDNINITAKYVFKRGIHSVFTVGEYTQARSYQTLSNITNRRLTKKRTKFNYFEIKICAYDNVYEVGQTYNLRLKYDTDDDEFDLKSSTFIF